MLLVNVALEIPQLGPLTYALRGLEGVRHEYLGRVVRVTLGKRQSYGVIVGTADTDNVDPCKIKNIELVLPIVGFDQPTIRLATFAAQYYCRGVGEVLCAGIPRWFKSTSIVRPKGKNGMSSLERLISSLGPSNQNTKEETHPSIQHALNVEQDAAYTAISGERGFAVHLLHGVTGSGKTEVYLALIASRLERHPEGQVLVMTPEIGLTPQLQQRIVARFGQHRVAVLHSEMSDRQRAQHWIRTAQGDAAIIIGTRLSILVPIPKLTMIIVDEEHDGSYKQQEGVRYQARDLAIWRAKDVQVPIVLGSATPSLETWQKVQQGFYRYHPIKSRAQRSAVLPEVQLININAKTEQGLSTQALSEIEACMTRGELALIFQNRRGYAPILSCQSCGWVQKCTACTVSPVLHRERNTGRFRSICHHCSAIYKVPERCPDCGDIDLSPIGRGTQRIEEFLKERFTEKKILRVDRDSYTTGTAAAEHLRAADAGNIDVVVGTQLIAKGHDLQRATLVIVLDADYALFSHDFRAPEHLFSLLMQVSGRAGRGQKPGKVLIQTRYPQHPLFSALKEQDFDRYASRLLEERKNLSLPPFQHHAIIRASAQNQDEAMRFLQTLRQKVNHPKELLVHDPLPQTPEYVAKRWRAQLLLESRSRNQLHQALASALQNIPRRFSTVDWHIDVDPLQA